MSAPLVLAHRGLHDAAPENTIAAIDAARAAGADGAEFDVRSLADGTQVLHHDAHVRQGRSRLALTDLDWAAFQIALGGRGASTLRDVATWSRMHSGFLLNVELKDSADLQRALPLLDIIPTPVRYVTSFDLGLLEKLRLLRPDWPLGLLSEKPTVGLVETARRAGMRFVVLRWRNFSAALAGAATATGLEVWTWGLRQRADAERAWKWGLRAVITDATERLVAWRQERADVAR